MRKFLFALILVCLGWHLLEVWPTPTAKALAPDQPSQSLLGPDGPIWDKNGYRFTALADYVVTARVLDREEYFFDRPASISPFDLVLGWGKMSNPTVYDQISIHQGFRWYMWSYSGIPPIPSDEISGNSANTHIIPSDSSVAGDLFWVRPGDVVKLSGYLVAVEGPHGFTWRSSLSRTDTGDGACEVFWVNKAAIVGR